MATKNKITVGFLIRLLEILQQNVDNPELTQGADELIAALRNMDPVVFEIRTRTRGVEDGVDPCCGACA